MSPSTTETIRLVALMLPALLFSLCVHEYAHAWAATRLGDDTPSRDGRLTLAPGPHVDVIGTLLFPLILIVMTGSVFGWAKPVAFNPANFHRRVSMRRGAALTAVAGPVSNVLLGLVCALVLFILAVAGFDGEGSVGEMVLSFLVVMVVLNGILAVFNLIPLPPLDGSYLLPRSMDEFKEKISGYSFLILFAVFFVPLPGVGTIGGALLRPFSLGMHGVIEWILATGSSL